MSFSWVDSFRYLGVNIHRTNNLSNGLKLTCHQAKKTQSTLDMHILSHPTVVLYCFVLHCIALHCIALHCIALQECTTERSQISTLVLVHVIL